ncbi:MAG: hypothetical protein R6U04_00790 [Bacteroidales bacterium]
MLQNLRSVLWHLPDKGACVEILYRLGDARLGPGFSFSPRGAGFTCEFCFGYEKSILLLWNVRLYATLPAVLF